MTPSRADCAVCVVVAGAGAGRCDPGDGARRDGVPGDDRPPAHVRTPQPAQGTLQCRDIECLHVLLGETVGGVGFASKAVGDRNGGVGS